MKEVNLNGKKRNCRWKISRCFSCYSMRRENCPITSFGCLISSGAQEVRELGDFMDGLWIIVNEHQSDHSWNGSLFSKGTKHRAVSGERTDTLQDKFQGLLEMHGGCSLSCSLLYRYSGYRRSIFGEFNR